MHIGRRVALLRAIMLPEGDMPKSELHQGEPWSVEVRRSVNESGQSTGFAITATAYITHNEAAALVLEQGGAIKMATLLFSEASPMQTAEVLTSEILVETIKAKLPRVRRRVEEIEEYEVTANQH